MSLIMQPLGNLFQQFTSANLLFFMFCSFVWFSVIFLFLAIIASLGGDTSRGEIRYCYQITAKSQQYLYLLALFALLLCCLKGE